MHCCIFNLVFYALICIDYVMIENGVGGRVLVLMSPFYLLGLVLSLLSNDWPFILVLLIIELINNLLISVGETTKKAGG